MSLPAAPAAPTLPARPTGAIDWLAGLGILRDAGARLHRLGPETSLREALQLIADTAVTLVDAGPADRPTAVIYTYDTALGGFDPASRVSAGEGGQPLLGDTPRPDGMGASALARRARVLSYEERRLRFHPLKFQAGIRTSACYPLLVAGQPVGALYIALHAGRAFSEEELLLLDTFVHLAAVAIYNTRQYEGMTRALQRKVDELERLQRAGRFISSRRTLDETLEEILKTALNLTGAEQGSFRLLDKRHGLLRLRALAVAGGERPAELPETVAADASGGVVGWVAQSGQPALIGDLRQPAWAHIYRPLSPRHEMRSELAVPLLGSGGGLEGVLNVESPRVAAFDDEAQSILEALANHAAIALQEAGLLDAIEAVTERMVAHAPDDVFALLLARACDLLNTGQAAIWQLQPGAAPSLELRASLGDFPPGYRVPLHGSLLGEAVLTRQPVVCADLEADPRLGRRDLARSMGWSSALIVPVVMRDGTPRGALGVYSAGRRDFSDWDTRLLTCLANHAAVSLQMGEALSQARLAEERQAVAETFAVLGDVSANLLHRVNNLIGVIPVKVQALADKRPALLEDRYIAATLADMETGARAAMEVARETVSYLRPLRLQPVALAGCCQAAVARLELPAHVRLVLAGLADLPPVLAGEEQLRLVVFNLVENALEALGDQPGTIRLSGRVVAEALVAGRRWVEVTAADDGPGVPAELRERIFDPDFSTKHSLKKLGFGLWWVKAWVQRCGGSIALISPAPAGEDAAGAVAEAAAGGVAGAAAEDAPAGHGCAFVIRLPPAAEPPSGANA